MKNITKKLFAISLALITALLCIVPAFALDTCETCNATFNDAVAYAMHQKICKELHEGEEILFYCSYCNENFTTKAAFLNHINNNHRMEAAIEKTGSTNTCEYCQGTFNKENAFNNHIQTCVKTYECNRCGVSFINSQACNVHQLLCSVSQDTKITLTIKNKPGSAKTVNYGDKVRIEAVLDKEVSSGCYIGFTVTGEGAKITAETSDGHYYCYVEATGSGSATVTAKLYLSDGTVVKNLNGEDVADSQQFTMKAGFFQKIISFFKDLFGANRVTVQ